MKSVVKLWNAAACFALTYHASGSVAFVGVIFACCRMEELPKCLQRYSLHIWHGAQPCNHNPDPLAVIAGFTLWIVGVPVLGMQYTFWKIDRVLDSVSKSGLIARTSDLPEVRAFLAKYENPRTYIDRDFHVAVIYAITECELTGQSCEDSRPFAAYLDVRIDLDTSYPESSIFWCSGERLGSFPLGDENLIQHIQSC